MKPDKNMERKKAEKKDIVNATTSISKARVSSNWFNYLESNGKIMKKTIKDPRRGCNVRSLKNSKSSTEPVITKVLSLDCEMVSDMDGRDMLGRVSIVNYKLDCIYDKFVKPVTPVGDYRTRFSGLRECDLKKGMDFEIVQSEVCALLRNKILVGHALGNDFKVLKFRHHTRLIRDTSKYEKFREVSEGRTPSLKKLATYFLGDNIQEGEHSSVEDARTAMKLYIKYRHEWEASILRPRETNDVSVPHKFQNTLINSYNY